MGLEIDVCHFPPGTSKWNRIEHRLFSHIGQNWRGRPLTSYQVIVDLIAATTTTTGLKVYARLDENDYPKKIKVTDRELAAVNITRRDWHPDGTTSSHPALTTTDPTRDTTNHSYCFVTPYDLATGYVAATWGPALLSTDRLLRAFGAAIREPTRSNCTTAAWSRLASLACRDQLPPAA